MYLYKRYKYIFIYIKSYIYITQNDLRRGHQASIHDIPLYFSCTPGTEDLQIVTFNFLLFVLYNCSFSPFDSVTRQQTRDTSNPVSPLWTHPELSVSTDQPPLSSRRQTSTPTLPVHTFLNSSRRKRRVSRVGTSTLRTTPKGRPRRGYSDSGLRGSQRTSRTPRAVSTLVHRRRNRQEKHTMHDFGEPTRLGVKGINVRWETLSEHLHRLDSTYIYTKNSC